MLKFDQFHPRKLPYFTASLRLDLQMANFFVKANQNLSHTVLATQRGQKKTHHGIDKRGRRHRL